MKPIISVTVDWPRLGLWISLRVGWIVILFFEGLSEDMGPDMQRFYSASIGFSAGTLVTATILSAIVWRQGLVAYAILLPILCYVLLYYLSSFIIRLSGLGTFPPRV